MLDEHTDHNTVYHHNARMRLRKLVSNFRKHHLHHHHHHHHDDHDHDDNDNKKAYKDGGAGGGTEGGSGSVRKNVSFGDDLPGLGAVNSAMVQDDHSDDEERRSNTSSEGGVVFSVGNEAGETEI